MLRCADNADSVLQDTSTGYGAIANICSLFDNNNKLLQYLSWVPASSASSTVASAANADPSHHFHLSPPQCRSANRREFGDYDSTSTTGYVAVDVDAVNIIIRTSLDVTFSSPRRPKRKTRRLCTQLVGWFTYTPCSAFEPKH